MPFIEVKTAKKLKSDVKLAIKAGIGASISLIPDVYKRQGKWSAVFYLHDRGTARIYPDALPRQR